MTTTAKFTLLDYRAEDGGILDAWIALHSDRWRYVTGHNVWYGWTGTHLERDECLALPKQIQTLMDMMNRIAKTEMAEAKKKGDDKEAGIFDAYVRATKRSRQRIASVESMAQAHRAIAAKTLDQGNVLNLRNGTLDLDTLTLRSHSPDDHLTYCLDYDYDPNAQCPRFEQFLNEVLVLESDPLQTDVKLCAAVQEAMGYSLTNDTRQHATFFLEGSGSNGKSVLLNVLKGLIGPLAYSVNFSLLGTTDGNYRLADLVGKRIAFCAETPKGSKAAENILNQIADGSTIDARPIRGEPIQFESQAKIWWAMNDLPTVKDTSDGFWRRMNLFPFYRKFEKHEQDKDLPAKLLAELPGILNFALDGLRRLRQQGRFTEAQAVTDAVTAYRQSANPVWQWMDERTEKNPGQWTDVKSLFQDYLVWCTRNGRQNLNSTNFGKEVVKLAAKKRGNAGWLYELTLKP